MTSSNSSSAKKRATSAKSKRSAASKSAVNAKDDVIRIDDNAALLEALGDALSTSDDVATLAKSSTAKSKSSSSKSSSKSPVKKTSSRVKTASKNTQDNDEDALLDPAQSAQSASATSAVKSKRTKAKSAEAKSSAEANGSAAKSSSDPNSAAAAKRASAKSASAKSAAGAQSDAIEANGSKVSSSKKTASKRTAAKSSEDSTGDLDAIVSVVADETGSVQHTSDKSKAKDSSGLKDNAAYDDAMGIALEASDDKSAAYDSIGGSDDAQVGFGVEEKLDSAETNVAVDHGLNMGNSAFDPYSSGIGIFNAFLGTKDKAGIKTLERFHYKTPAEVEHANGSKFDVSSMVDELKHLSPELLEKAKKEFMGGFSTAANDLLVYRRLEELGGGDYIKDLSYEQLQKLSSEFDEIKDAALYFYETICLIDYSAYLDNRARKLAPTFFKYYPDQTAIGLLFVDDDEFKETEEYVKARSTIIKDLLDVESSLVDTLETSSLGTVEGRLQLDEAIFYEYLLCAKKHLSHDIDSYKVLVDVSNFIDLFKLIHESFITSNDFDYGFRHYGRFNLKNEGDLTKGLTQYTSLSVDDIDPMEIDNLHFAYLEPVFMHLMADDASFALLNELVSSTSNIFRHELNKKVGGNLTADCDFTPALQTFLFGKRAAYIGQLAVMEASEKIANDDTRPLFLCDIFLNKEALDATRVNEYQKAVDIFKDSIEDAVRNDSFTDEMKEWALHIYHNTEIFNKACLRLNNTVTAGEGTVGGLNMDNDRVMLEMLFFYSKFLVNEMRREVLYDAQGNVIEEDTPEWQDALVQKEDALMRGESYPGQEFEPELVGDNGIIPIIPGTPALSAFLIGRAYTYGEFLAEQNPDFAFSALKYADFTGSFMATSYLGLYYLPLFQPYLSSRGELLLQYHLRGVLAYQLGEICAQEKFNRVSFFRNQSVYTDGSSLAKYYKVIQNKDKQLDYVLSLNPTLHDNDRFDGIQPLAVSAYGSMLGNSVILMCDLLLDQPKLIDRYIKTLEILMSLTELQMAKEYSPVCCFAMYRFLSSDWTHRTFSTGRILDRFHSREVLGSLITRQLMPSGLNAPVPGSLIGEDFDLSDIAAVFLQIGMFYSDYRDQGYALLNSKFDSLKGNFAPLTAPYLDELYKTSAALQNGNSLSYMTEVESALGHESKSDLYALVGSKQFASKTFKNAVHYFTKNDLNADRDAFSKQLCYLNRPYGYYERYLCLKDDPKRLSEAHTYLFYAARMSIAEAMSDLEALEKANLFKPLPFVIYIRYLEELAKTDLQAVLVLFLLSQNGDLLPPNQVRFVEFIEKYHQIFSNSGLKRALMERGFINPAIAKRHTDHQTSWYGMFGVESENLRKNNEDIDGNSARCNSIIEVFELVDLNYLINCITDQRIQEIVGKLFERLAKGTTDFETKLLFNWTRSEYFPEFLKASARNVMLELTVIESPEDIASIDFLMSMYTHVLDSSFTGLYGTYSLSQIKHNSHPLAEANEVGRIFKNLTESGFAPITINSMTAFALNALRGPGRPNLGLFKNLIRFLANQGMASAERLVHLDLGYLSDYPYGKIFDRLVLRAQHSNLDMLSELNKSESVYSPIIQNLVESKFKQDSMSYFADEANKDNESLATQDIASADGIALESNFDEQHSQDSKDGGVNLASSLKDRAIANALDLQSLLSESSLDHVKTLHEKFVKECYNQICLNDVQIFADFYSGDKCLSTVSFSFLSEFIEQDMWFSYYRDYLSNKDEYPQEALEDLNREARHALDIKCTINYFLKHLINFEFFKRSQGLSLLQSVIFSRNGWQLGRKMNGPKRSYTSLLAKDLLLGMPGALERFNYYVNSHRFKYKIHEGFFIENEHISTARNFVENVLQLDINSEKFSEFAQSMYEEGFSEFTDLLEEEENGYVNGTYRFMVPPFEYDPQTGMVKNSLLDSEILCYSTEQALFARSSLKGWAHKIDELSKADLKEREQYFYTSDYEFIKAYGEKELVLRNEIERILGPDNIERLIYEDNRQWINYTFYDRSGVTKHDLIKMMPQSCSILPSSILKHCSYEDQALILNKSFKPVNKGKNNDQYLANLLRIEADDLNAAQLWGITYDERANRWHLSKEQLVKQISKEYVVYSQELRNLRSFSSSYSDAIYQVDSMRVLIANQRRANNDNASFVSSTDAKRSTNEYHYQSDILDSAASNADASLDNSKNPWSSSVLSEAAFWDIDEGSAATLSEGALAQEYLPEESVLWDCINKHLNYDGQLFVSRAEITPESMIRRAKIMAANAGSTLARQSLQELDKNNADDNAVLTKVDESSLTHGSYDGLSDGNDIKDNLSAAALDKPHKGTSDTLVSSAASGDEDVFTSLKEFLSGKLSGGNGEIQAENMSASQSGNNASETDGTGDLMSLFSRMNVKSTDKGVDYLKDELDNKSSFASYIFSNAWHFDESLEHQYTRPVMFHEDENPLHALLHLFINVLSSQFQLIEKYEFEEKTLNNLNRTGYFYGACDLVDSAFVATVLYSYRCRYQRKELFEQNEFEFLMSCRSLVTSIIGPEDSLKFFGMEDSACNAITKKVAEKLLMPPFSTKAHLMSVLYPSVDNFELRASSRYRAILSAPRKLFKKVNMPFTVEDSLLNAAFYDLFMNRELLLTAPNLLPFYDFLEVKCADLPEYILQAPFKPTNKYLATLDKLLEAKSDSKEYQDSLDMNVDGCLYYESKDEVSHFRTHKKFSDNAACKQDRNLQLQLRRAYDKRTFDNTLVVNSTESYYATTEQARFHRGLSIGHGSAKAYTKADIALDPRRVRYIARTFGGYSFDYLSHEDKIYLGTSYTGMSDMQEALVSFLFDSTWEKLSNPFTAEYIDYGLSLSYKYPWDNSTIEEIGANYTFMHKMLEYSPKMTGTVAEFRDQVDISHKEQKKFAKFYAEHPFVPEISSASMVLRHLIAGLHDLAYEYELKLSQEGIDISKLSDDALEHSLESVVFSHDFENDGFEQVGEKLKQQGYSQADTEAENIDNRGGHYQSDEVDDSEVDYDELEMPVESDDEDGEFELVDEGGILDISEDDVNEFIDFLSSNELDPTDIESMAEMIASAYIQRMRKQGISDNEIVDRIFDKDGNFDVHGAFEELMNQSSPLDHDENVIDAVIADDDDATVDDDAATATVNDDGDNATATATAADGTGAAASADSAAKQKRKAAGKGHGRSTSSEAQDESLDQNHQTQARKQGAKGKRSSRKSRRQLTSCSSL